MADLSYQPKTYRELGGDRFVVASGGSLDVESGGEIDIESNGAFKIAGSAVSAAAAEINKLAGVTAGSVTAGKGLVVGANRELATIGPITGDGIVSIAKTITSATPATERLVRSEYTLTPTTSLAIADNGSIVGVRGCVTLTSGKGITAGFLYGVQGKLIGDGATLAVGSAHICAVLAQLSLSGATVTNGHVAMLICSGQNLPNTAGIDAIYVESGGDGKAINSVLKTICNALLVFDLDYESAAGNVCMATTSTSTTNIGTMGWLKIKVHGITRYIPLADDVT